MALLIDSETIHVRDLLQQTMTYSQSSVLINALAMFDAFPLLARQCLPLLTIIYVYNDSITVFTNNWDLKA